MSDAEESIKVDLEIHPSGGDVTFRTVMLGYQSVILLEVEVDEDENEVTFKLTGSQLETLEELVELVESFAEVAREALNQQAAEEGS